VADYHPAGAVTGRARQESGTLKAVIAVASFFMHNGSHISFKQPYDVVPSGVKDWRSIYQIKMTVQGQCF
jgi:hypothetical protein